MNTADYAVGAQIMSWYYDVFGTYVRFIWLCVGIIAVVLGMYQLVISVTAKERKKDSSS